MSQIPYVMAVRRKGAGVNRFGTVLESNTTAPSSRTPLVTLRSITMVLTAVVLWAVSLAPTEAGHRQGIELVAAEQAVMIGHIGAVFEAKVITDANNQACGFVKFTLHDGTIIELEPIHQIVQRPRGTADAQTVEFPNNLGVILMLTPRGGPPPQPDDFVVATVTPVMEVGSDIWDFTGSTMTGGLDMPFDAETQRSGSDERCEPADFGQIDTSFGIHAPRQTVIPFDADETLDFGSDAFIASDHAAHGIVYAPLSDQGGLYKLFFGALLSHARGTQAYLVGVRPDTRGLPTTDDLLRATVTPLEANPDNQIWDLVNGTTGCSDGSCGAVFEAETDLRLPPTKKRR